MISRLHYSPATAIAMHENKGLLSPSWEKMFRFTNITLIVVGIAVSFFLKVPLFAAGLGTYGIFYFLYLLRGNVKDEAQSLQTSGVVEKGKYDKARKKVAELEKRIIAYDVTIKDRDREIKDLKRKINGH